MTKEMHHLVIGDDSFEVVDNSAREQLLNKADSADVASEFERIDETIGDNTMTTDASTLTGAVNELDAKRSNNIASGYAIAAKAFATTNFTIIPMATDYVVGQSFVKISDGGYRATRSGLVLVSASCNISGVNADDVILVAIGRYNAGWVYEAAGHFAVGIATDRSCDIANFMMNVNENDIIYLRARNATAARGSVTSARMTIEYV